MTLKFSMEGRNKDELEASLTKYVDTFEEKSDWVLVVYTIKTKWNWLRFVYRGTVEADFIKEVP